MLAGEDLLDGIQQLLDVHPSGEDALTLDMIDGVLAALVLSPEPVPPEEWLEKLGIGPEAPFANPEDGARLRDLLLARQSEIAGQLLAGDLAYEPVFGVGQDGEPIWQLWLIGFLQAMHLRFDAWQPLFESDDEDLATSLTGLISLASTFPGLAGAAPELEVMADGIEEMIGEAPEIIPYLVETAYRRRHGLPRVVLTDGWGFPGEDDEPFAVRQPVRVEKIGRNEPCPCGSGKKYKKCCGA